LNGRVKELSESCLNLAAHGGKEHVAEALLRDLDDRSQGGTFKMVSIAIPAGQELAGHQSPVPAMLLVVEGESRFVAEDEELRLAPGTVVREASPQGFVSRSPTRLMVLIGIPSRSSSE